MIRLTRRYRFPASHRLHSEALSDRENAELYGKCNNPYGHGHDYLLEITVAGPVDARTGQAVRIAVLDDLVEECVLRRYGHKNLNLDLPEFERTVPTSENVALAIERALLQSWGEWFPEAGPKLQNVSLHETKRNRFELR